ncbi:MAG: hypothetical protein HW387_1035 [Parachlamydiales bacterium]|nr:hypothetical protein [Parachlamydiales bacterium]
MNKYLILFFLSVGALSANEDLSVATLANDPSALSIRLFTVFIASMNIQKKHKKKGLSKSLMPISIERSINGAPICA